MQTRLMTVFSALVLAGALFGGAAHAGEGAALSRVNLSYTIGKVSAAKSGVSTTALISELAVVPFVVEPEPFQATPPHLDEESVLQKLSREATAQAERVLVDRNVAAITKPVKSREEATGRFVLTGTIRLPVSLPAGISPDSYRGRFATAEVILWDRAGKMLARQDVSLLWSDGAWTYEAKNHHFYRNIDDVIAEFTRNAVNRAVNGIVGEHGFREIVTTSGNVLNL